MEKALKKTIDEFVRKTRNILKDNLLEGYLFGSAARNENKIDSDVDILFIVKKYNPQLRKSLSFLASEYSINQNVLISPILKDNDTWQKNKKHDTLFFNEIMKDGLKLC